MTFHDLCEEALTSGALYSTARNCTRTTGVFYANSALLSAWIHHRHWDHAFHDEVCEFTHLTYTQPQ
ncbi:hypothetical protein PILCRDRAFT_815184 [Piloderma croceum F 1598]|uniref:Uncharacterized protein n=1 Tax=Piloderma croceum (strain F 1598) TaxID=765440 RepID=A0A0C3CD61_PILCF|nr:hypothetical protein PILCRDRAFT_815184 [Piloderma croceum F 1598]